MSFTKEVKKTIQKQLRREKSDDYGYGAMFRQKMLEQRKKNSTSVRIDKPSNLPRARSLGYKAKEGFIVALTRVRKGSGLHRRPNRGRRPKRMGVKKLTRRINRKIEAEKHKRYDK